MKRQLLKGITPKGFKKRFNKDEDCYKYLSELKWADESFVCKRCGHTHYCKGHLPYARRCTRCKHDESPLAGTVFEKIKFSLLTAFQLIFDFCTIERRASTITLSSKYDIRQKTIWEFKHKVQQSIGCMNVEMLGNNVYLGKFIIEDNRKRQATNNIVVALEISGNGGVGRAYAEIIDCTSDKATKEFLERHCHPSTTIFISKEKENDILINGWSDVQFFSNNEAVEMLNEHISELKNWLCGNHRNCSHEHIQGYLNEYYFRFNLRKQKSIMFSTLVSHMANTSPKRTKSKS